MMQAHTNAAFRDRRRLLETPKARLASIAARTAHTQFALALLRVLLAGRGHRPDLITLA